MYMPNIIFMLINISNFFHKVLSNIRKYKYFFIVITYLISNILLFVFMNNYLKKNKYQKHHIEKIREEKQIQIISKQKGIDSLLIEIKNKNQWIDKLNNDIELINNRNNKLKEDLDRKKNEIKKMNNDEIIKYWNNEFKK